MSDRFSDRTGQIRCCGDVKESDAGWKLQAIGLRTEGGHVPVDAPLEPAAKQRLEQEGFKPGDFVRALVNYHRADELFSILQIIHCEKLEERERADAELFFSFQTTSNGPTTTND